MAEPIAVAFVEIRPEPGSFQAATEAEVRGTFGSDPIDVPTQVRLTGADDAVAEVEGKIANIDGTIPAHFQPETEQVERHLRELRQDEVEIPVEPDLSTFRADLDREVRAVTAGAPVTIPTQIAPVGAVGGGAPALSTQTAVTQQAAAADTHAAEAAHAHAEGEAHVAEEAGHAAHATEGLAAATEHAGHAAGEAAGGHGAHAEGIAGVSAGAGEAVGQVTSLFVANENLAKGHARLAVQDEKLGIANLGVAQSAITVGEAQDFLDQQQQGSLATSVRTEQQNVRVAASNQKLAASEAIAQRAIQRTEKEEKDLIRARVRRAVPVGPLRLAGVGTLVATGVVAASQAVAELGEALRVTGEEGDTFVGRMRNVGANILNFNVIGAFQALTSSHDELSVAQLRLIGQAPEVVAVMKEIAGATDFAASQQAALAAVTEVPQFLTAALAREQGEGDIPGQIKVLEQQLDFLVRGEEVIRSLGLEQEELNTALAALIPQRTQTRDAIAELLGESLPGLGHEAQEALAEAQEEGEFGVVGDILRRQAKAQRRGLTKAEAAVTEQEGVEAELRTLNAKIRRVNAEVNEATREALESASPAERLQILAEGPSAFEDFESGLANLAQAKRRELRSLQDDRIELEKQIEKLGLEAAKLEALEHALEETNHQIEEAEEALAEEEERHRLEMAAKQAAVLETPIILAQIADNIRAEITATEALRDFYQRKSELKGITVAERNQYLSRVESLNDQIEGLEAGILAEEEQAATAAQEARDKQHQALLDQISADEQEILNDLIRAGMDASLQNDIKFQKQLLNFYRQQAQNKKLSLEERRNFITQAIQAEAELKSLIAEEKQARADRIRSELDAREDALQDQLTLAQLDERGTKDDARRLNKLIAFYRRQSKNDDLTVAERRKYLIKLRQAQKDLRELKGEEDEDRRGFDQIAFDFLQTETGFFSNVAGNLIPGFATGGLVGGTMPGRIKREKKEPFGPTSAADASGTRPVTSGQGNVQIELLRKLLTEARRQNRGQEHPEARQQRRTGAATGDYGGNSSVAM